MRVCRAPPQCMCVSDDLTHTSLSTPVHSGWYAMRTLCPRRCDQSCTMRTPVVSARSMSSGSKALTSCPFWFALNPRSHSRTSAACFSEWADAVHGDLTLEPPRAVAHEPAHIGPVAYPG